MVVARSFVAFGGSYAPVDTDGNIITDYISTMYTDYKIPSIPYYSVQQTPTLVIFEPVH